MNTSQKARQHILTPLSYRADAQREFINAVDRILTACLGQRWTDLSGDKKEIQKALLDKITPRQFAEKWLKEWRKND